MYNLYFHIVESEDDTHKSVSKIRTKKVYWFAPPHRCPGKQLNNWQPTEDVKNTENYWLSSVITKQGKANKQELMWTPEN